MDCVQCARPLKGIEYEGALIHSCGGCGGEFVSGDALAHVVRTREERFPAGPDDVAWRPDFGGPLPARHRAARCPVCLTAMDVGNYGGDSGVAIDRCRACGGVWLDHEELERVQRLAELATERAEAQLRAIAGELDAERRASAERSGAGTFQGSRFAFVNALVNRILDVA